MARDFAVTASILFHLCVYLRGSWGLWNPKSSQSYPAGESGKMRLRREGVGNSGPDPWRERWGLGRRGTEIPAREGGRRRWEGKKAKLAALPLPGQPPVSRPQPPRPGARWLARVPVACSGWVSAPAPPRSLAFLQVPPAEQPGRQRRHLRGRAQPGPVGGALSWVRFCGLSSCSHSALNLCDF